jgi:hypothetical protein
MIQKTATASLGWLESGEATVLQAFPMKFPDTVSFFSYTDQVSPQVMERGES